MLTKKTQKNPKNFLCKLCGFVSSNIKDYKRHISTRKHKMLTNVDNCIIAESKIQTPPEIFACECGKVYKHRQSLSVHKKKCNFVDNSHD